LLLLDREIDIPLVKCGVCNADIGVRKGFSGGAIPGVNGSLDASSSISIDSIIGVSIP
jgi:hypothetical protein